MNPEISIIVPFYNVDKYISKCIESILNQTFTNIELILINDGSTDLSGEICDKYAIQDNRIKVIHKNHEGVSVARNIAVKIAKGNYIGFIDSDDYIESNMYEKLYNLCTTTNSDISICKLRREVNGVLDKVNDDNEIIELDNVNALKELFKGQLYRFSLCNKLFKKECFNEVEFPKGRIHEDLSTTYKLFANSKKAVFQRYSSYIYVKRKNSILTSEYNEKRLQIFIGWDEIIQFMITQYPDLLDRVIECFTYTCIDHSYYIVNQLDEKSRKIFCINIVNKYISKYYKNMMKNKKLSRRNKIIIKIIKFNSKTFINLNYMKKLINA